MSLLTLEDPARAAVCFEAAVNAADPLESKHIPLLHKLLEQQEHLKDDLGTGRTSELLASFSKAADERAGLLVTAAAAYRRAGHDDRARLAAERAVEASPYDLTAVTAASELAMQEGDFEATAAMLGRALSSSSSEDDDIAGPRKALLWSRLAQARRERGDIKGTVSACEQAIDAAPDSSGCHGC